MASNGEAVSPHGGATTGAAWGRVNSNTSKDIVFNVSEEEAPLLGNDGTQDELEWEGAADFINEPWWNKPSVCCNSVFNNFINGILTDDTKHVLIISILDVVDITQLPALRPRVRWHNRPQTQPYTFTRLPRIPL